MQFWNDGSDFIALYSLLSRSPSDAAESAADRHLRAFDASRYRVEIMLRPPVVPAPPQPKKRADTGSHLVATYDKFRDVTSLHTPRMRVSGSEFEGIEIDAWYAWSGAGTSPAAIDPARDTVAFMVHSVRSLDDDWLLSGARDIILLVDGERISFDAERRGDVTQRLLFEEVRAEIPLGRLLRVANATKVEGKTGGTTFVLRPNQLAVLREFAARLASPALRPSAAARP
jgi:hypothetical protein